ncbi:MAG: FecR family protein [Pseudomonadota bacterium]
MSKPMNKRRWFLHIYEQSREPTAAAEARLQAALREHIPDGRASRSLLAQIDPPSDDAQARLLARVAALPEEQPRVVRSHQRWALPALALAGATALAATVGVVAWQHGAPEEPAALATTALGQQPAPVGLAPVPGVSLAYRDGYGELGGTTMAPEIHWISGQLDVEVEPNRGIQLAVQTEEATVRVIGTRFSVLRRDGITSVTVQRGKVEVTCADGSESLLTLGQATTCEPRSAARLALRALAMQQKGGGPARVLSLTERGLASAEEGDATWAQLSVLRMVALRDLGRDEEALAAAHAYLASGDTRRVDEVLRLALSLSAERCDLALAERVRVEAASGATELAILSDCVAAREPQHAAELLIRALEDPTLDAEGRERIETRLKER